jgi:hypothetical protein
MELGLSRDSIKLILEDALKEGKDLTKETIIDAVTMAIDENNKKLKQDIKQETSRQVKGFIKKQMLQANRHP